jgi:thymidine kinase
MAYYYAVAKRQRDMGELHIIVGPMFSGKSTKCWEMATGLREIQCPVLIAKPFLDTRSTDVTTHSRLNSIECIRPYRVRDILSHSDYGEAKVVLIDEAQFFDGDELVTGVRHMLADGKIIRLYGLCGNYKQEPMWPLHRLIAICDTIEKVSAYCSFCAHPTPAYFTVTDMDMPNSGIAPGGAERYSAVCRHHLK